MMAGTGLRLLTSSRLLRRDVASTCILQSARGMFYEKDRKGGYDTKIERPKKELIKEGMGMIRPEFRKWKNEWGRVIRNENIPAFPIGHGDYEVAWKFDNQQVVDEWLPTVDADHSEGSSKAEFVLGPNKTGIFRGYLNTTVPKDGKTKHAGYCSIKSPRNLKSFKREIGYQWGFYNHLLMRVRGDGRAYQIVLSMQRDYDIQWNDVYNYALFTRGGPYWQTAKIPFSKFYLGSKGRIQNKQGPVMLDKVLFMAVTAGDDVDGPFHLEIDYIGLIHDSNHKDSFDYEMFEVQPYEMY